MKFITGCLQTGFFFLVLFQLVQAQPIDEEEQEKRSESIHYEPAADAEEIPKQQPKTEPKPRNHVPPQQPGSKNHPPQQPPRPQSPRPQPQPQPNPKQKPPQARPQPHHPTRFYEVDALGDDYVDFGAITGALGAFSWHANYPLEQR